MFSKEDLLFMVPETALADQATGQYAQKVMVIVAAEPAFPGWKDFLEKLLGAAKINLQQDTRLYWIEAGTSFRVAQEIKNKQPEQVLFFGIQPDSMGLHIQVSKYQPLFFCNTTMVFADALSKLEPDRNLKTQMWTALKVMFKIA
jgi:hypothetical protein